MESLEKSLKTSFVGAANQITQLYTNSLNFQKQAYVHGYNQATRDALEFVLKHYSPNTRTIPIDNLLEHLKNKLEENRAPFNNADGPKSEVDNDIPTNEGRQSTPSSFFKFDNGFTPSNGRSNSSMGTSMSTGFNFDTMNEQRTHPIEQQQDSIHNVFNFLPPEGNPIPLPPQLQPHSPQDPQNVFNNQDLGMKKRHFEIPTNSMDYCYPEQFYKKSRVIG